VPCRIETHGTPHVAHVPRVPKFLVKLDLKRKDEWQGALAKLFVGYVVPHQPLWSLDLGSF